MTSENECGGCGERAVNAAGADGGSADGGSGDDGVEHDNGDGEDGGKKREKEDVDDDRGAVMASISFSNCAIAALSSGKVVESRAFCAASIHRTEE